MSNDRTTTPTPRVRLTPHGMLLGDRSVPILAGSLHYYHLEVEHWRPALLALKELGLGFVDTYVPWGVHERGAGYDFGQGDPRLNVSAFLELVAELGLYAIVRPGPHVNAELTRFGIPERVVWDPECMARSPSGAPVVLPAMPLCFPLPSYASRKFQEEVAKWYERVAAAIGHLCFPAGPIVMLQVDNEAALGFRDGVFDQDFHDDSIAGYRSFLEAKYSNLETARRLHKNPALSFSKARPTEGKSIKHISDLPQALDWAEAQESSLAASLAFMASCLGRHFPGAILSHNLPPGFEVSVLDPGRLEASIDLIGADYYHEANGRQRRAIFERTSTLRARARASKKPCFAGELGIGFPPYFRPHTETDSRFAAMCALAYGVQGFNLYMAVERDRWIGAPIAADGTPREEADFYRRLVAAVTRTRLYELEPEYAVCIVVPRELQRLTRVLHALDPLSPTLLSAITGDPLLGPSEHTLGMPSSLVMDSWEFLGFLQSALEQAKIPYTLASADQLGQALLESQWTIVVCCSVLQQRHWELVQTALSEGRPVTLGPYFPSRDAGFEDVSEHRKLPETKGRVDALLGLNQPAIAKAVKSARVALSLPSLSLEGEVHGALFTEHQGFPELQQAARVAFVLNSGATPVTASWQLAALEAAHDALTGEAIPIESGALRLKLDPKSARMLELTRIS